MKNYSVNPNILFKSNKDNTEITVINIDSSADDYYIIRGISIEFWGLIAQNQSRESIIDHLINEYEIERSTLEKDFDFFIAELKTKNILL
jgi:hypothetical protein